MAREGTETVTVVRKAKADRLKPVAGATQEFDVKKCHVIPRASQEAEGGWVQIDGFTVIAPGGSDITADDQLRVRGNLYSVIGKPGRFVKRRKEVAVIATTERSS